MKPRAADRGYVLVALLAAIAIMLIGLTAAVPGWRYVMKDDREEELMFRGGQIADAIQRFQQKRGNALPTTIEVLVKERFLRKAYKDPMTPHGKWRQLRPGEVAFPGAPGLGGLGTSRGGPQPAPTPTPGGSSRPGGQGAGTSVGPFNGVASFSTEKSLRLFIGQDRYDRWLFIAGQPRWVGKPPTPKIGPQTRPTPPTSTTTKQ